MKMSRSKRLIAFTLAVICVIALPVSAYAFCGNKKNNSYFCIGDSIATNGYDGGIKGKYGYIDGSYPDLVADYFDVESCYFGSHCGWRTNEARLMLEDDYSPDAFTLEFLPTYGGDSYDDIVSRRADYREALAKADLVTVNLGSNDLMGNFSYIAQKAFIDLTVGTRFEKAALKTIKAVRKLPHISAVRKILSDAETMGKFKVLLDEMAKEMPGVLSEFKDNWDHLVKDIRSICGRDTIIVAVGIFNPGLAKNDSDDIDARVKNLAAFEVMLEPVFASMNAHMKYSSVCLLDPNYAFADMSDMDMTGSVDGNHPGQKGHSLMADSIIKTVNRMTGCVHRHTSAVDARPAGTLVCGYSGRIVCDDCGRLLCLGYITMPSLIKNPFSIDLSKLTVFGHSRIFGC